LTELKNEYYNLYADTVEYSPYLETVIENWVTLAGNTEDEDAGAAFDILGSNPTKEDIWAWAQANKDDNRLAK